MLRQKSQLRLRVLRGSVIVPSCGLDEREDSCLDRLWKAIPRGHDTR
jgi:hypothetical protein